MIRTLVFVEDGRWLRLDGRVTRGDDIAALPALDPALAAETIAVVPGEAVTLHWVDLPALAPAQALAAARLLAADVSAGPVDALHIALGPVEGDGGRVLALTDLEAMQGWLARLAAAGVTTDAMVPAPLLLPVPEAGVTVLDDGRMWTARGTRLGFAAEPALAPLLIGDLPITRLDEAAWLAALPGVLAAPLLDLRQGSFSPVQRWQPDRRRLRRLTVAALAVLGIVLATEVVASWRYMVAADRAEARLEEAARQVLPRGTVVTDPRGQVAARAAQVGGAGFAGLAGPLLRAIRDLGGVNVQSIEFAPATGLVVMMSVPAPPEREAIMAALVAAGLEAEFGMASETAGVPGIELRIRPR
jgi:general secretion pathway protein L